MGSDLLKIEHATKRFPGVVALNDISFSVTTGEVHGIVGENGAGKSTLIKAIMGAYTLDEGKISILHDDKYVSPRDALEAKRLGMYADYQHVSIADDLSVAENYFLGQVPKNSFGIVDWNKMYKESRKILDKFHMQDVKVKTKVNDLPIALKEMIMISKISMIPSLKLVIFDEPTALLENQKVEELFEYIAELKAQGKSIIYISHHLEEIIQICDRVTVLKDGNYITTKQVKDVDRDTLISLMVGRKIDDIYNIKHMNKGETIFSVKELNKNGKFKDISFDVSAGEIVGFFGLVGAGRSEVMRAIFGADKLDSGELYIRNRKVRIKDTNDAMHKGIGLIPEDRLKEGVALELSVMVNTNMSSYDMISKCGIINTQKEKERAKKYVKAIRIKTPSIRQIVKNLSGGNQQKVVISKLLCRDLDLFIFDEPTVGVDIGAKQEIYHLIEELSNQGKAIVIISSYLPEVMGLSDRLIIMANGKITGELIRSEYTDEDALRLASEED